MKPAARHIVIVDDDDAYREVLVLAAQACHDGPVRDFADGEGALAWLPAAPADALWLVDLHMPRMPGLEVIDRLRASRPLAWVAGVSGAATEQERQACLAAGAMAVLRKPGDFAQVVACLRELLRLCGERRAG